jgi:hypothetical protein
MRFMLLQYYGPVGSGAAPMDEWSEDDVRAHIDFQIELNKELEALGELVEANALTRPEEAKVVTSDGVRAPVITDGPYPETKELVAGYRMIDVASLDRALEIAGRAAAAPGQHGEPIQDHIEVRQVMGGPSDLGL